MQKGKWILIGLSIIALICVYYFFNPKDFIWFPKCPFYVLTGYQCPACGSQRAIYCLLHFQIKDALFYNPFLVISTPYVLLLILTTWIIPKNRFQRTRSFCYHPYTVNTYIILLVCWWILRNIDLGI